LHACIVRSDEIARSHDARLLIIDAMADVVAVRRSSLLAAKLNPPVPAPAQVARTALLELVRGAPLARLIVMRAPAGFGKTTAMTQLRDRMEEQGLVTSWLTLDPADNDASRFFGYLAAAASRFVPDEGSSSVGGQDEMVSGVDVTLRIMDRLAASVEPFALFLDDFQYIHEPVITGLLRQMIEQLPRGGQIVIGSRSLPDLALARLRAHGHLLEIDAEVLRFSAEETAEFLTRQRGLALSTDDLSLLQRKTEGWIAGLWLASMALERRDARTEFIARFSGSNQAVADYLANDVLASQPPDVRDFLRRTSILRHLSAPLCDALTGREDSTRMLNELDTGNLFITRIEGEPETYRYHSLFASFLRADLAGQMPGEVPRLHGAASKWYEAQDRPVPAIDHALEAKDYERALHLLAQHAEELLGQGRMRLLQRWFSALPEDVLARRPLLQVIAVWSLCFTRGPSEALVLLERTGCQASEDAEVRAHVLALRPVLLAMLDRPEQAILAGRESVRALPTCKAFADSAMTNAMAYAFSVLGEYSEARKLLDTARRTQGESASAFNMMYSESVEGIIDLQEGRLRQAAARFRMALGANRASSYAYANGNAWPGVLHASTLYEANECEKAQRLLQGYVPLAEDVWLIDHMIIGRVMLSRIAFSRGDVDAAWRELTELEYLGHRRKLSRVVASAKLERARVLLLQGYFGAAKDELDRANDRDVWRWARDLRLLANDIHYLELGQLRWESHAGDARRALVELDRELTLASAGSRQRRALKLRVLKSVALYRGGELQRAIDSIGDTLRAGCAEGFIRLIIDEGPLVGSLVNRFETTLSEDVQREPIFGEYLQRLRHGFGSGIAELDEGSLPSRGSVSPEAFTRREIHLLQLLAEGYSNNAMAEKLFVSNSTVRTHLRNISSKLGAGNRTQAVAIARRLGLIR
jgi:LuxR family maltose regulon positive regulatory protein